MLKNADWVIWSAMALLATAPAISGESVVSLMRSCASQADGAARLKCYDSVAARIQGLPDGTTCTDAGGHDGQRASAAADNSANASSPASASSANPPSVTTKSGTAAPAPSTPAPAPSTTRELNATEQFGLTSGQVLRQQSEGRAPTPLKRLTARVAGVTPGRSGHIVVRLDNDQVWEQTEDGPDLNIAAGDTVTIDRGLLGAYFLAVQSRRAAIKVRRIQ
jgi:hypothetical protein